MTNQLEHICSKNKESCAIVTFGSLVEWKGGLEKVFACRSVIGTETCSTLSREFGLRAPHDNRFFFLYCLYFSNTWTYFTINIHNLMVYAQIVRDTWQNKKYNDELPSCLKYELAFRAPRVIIHITPWYRVNVISPSLLLTPTHKNISDYLHTSNYW